MSKTLIEVVQSTIQLTEYQERGDGYKIPTPILAKALRSKITAAADMPLEVIQTSDLEDMSDVLLELGKSLKAMADSGMCHYPILG